jgi:hypothetical protein
MSRLADVLITRFIDDELLKITSMVNVNRAGQEYNQVVLIGDGMCTRAFRLPWPSGVAMYLVAPAEVHERAEAILASNKIRAPRGCLLRRVDCNLQNAGSCANALQQAGYRGDRVAAWAIQVRLQTTYCYCLQSSNSDTIVCLLSCFVDTISHICIFDSVGFNGTQSWDRSV